MTPLLTIRESNRCTFCLCLLVQLISAISILGDIA